MIRIAAILAAGLLLGGCGGMGKPKAGAPDGATAASPASVSLHANWTQQIAAAPSGRFAKLRLAADEKTLYAASPSGRVYAFDLKSGARRWELALGTAISGGLTYANGGLWLGTPAGELIALDAAKGSIRWRTRVSSEVLARPQVAEGVVVVATTDGQIFGLDETGGRLWAYQRSVPTLTLRGASAPLIHQGAVIAGFASGKLAALDLRKGSLRWEVDVAVPRGRTELERMVDIDADIRLIDDTVYVASYQSRIAAVEPTTGRTLWARDISSYAGLTGDARQLYVVDDTGNVLGLDRRSGAVLWKQDNLKGRELTAPALLDNHVVLGDNQGNMSLLRTEDGAIAATVALQDFFPTRQARLQSLWDDSGDIVVFNKNVPYTGVSAVPLSLNGWLYVTNNSGLVVAANITPIQRP